MREIWKDIKGWEGLYQVSNLGRVKNLERKTKNRHGYKTWPEKIRKFQMHRKGYHLIILCNNGYRKTYYVHRIVANAFIENPENKREVNHVDGNKLNNSIDNLEWSTREENMLHWKNEINQPKGYSISKHEGDKTYICSISIDNKRYNLGRYKTKEECRNVYIEANMSFYGKCPKIKES